jgi:hypothetical protein
MNVKKKDEEKIVCQDQGYSKKCSESNKLKLENELQNRKVFEKEPEENSLYPHLDDPNFIIKISQKKEFSDAKYDGDIHNVEEYSEILKNAEYELLPQQAFVRNFLSFQTPYNSLLLFHGLGSGKTCSAIGVCEEMRDYLRQMGINKRIIIVASPNVQDNFKLQLFDERKLVEVDGLWSMKGCIGNKLLKEINPTGMKGLSKEGIVQRVKNLVRTSYSFKGYVEFSNLIAKTAGEESRIETKIRNLENEFSNSLIVIDEVHNIRISDDNENKNVAKNLMFLVSVVSNIRLLLLSATPMFNSYKEIIWLINLMNMNDRRGIVSISDIFDSSGGWKKDNKGKEIGKEMLIRKATGYISYIRGENPYTFPFRVYPDRFSKTNIFKNVSEYPKYQLNGHKIKENTKIKKLSIFLTNIGEYQEKGYKYILDRLRNREERIVKTKKGKNKKIIAFSSMKAFGYTDLQLPIEALNIIYPHDSLDKLVKYIEPIEFIDEESDSEDDDDIAPNINDTDVADEIDDVISNGPKEQQVNESEEPELRVSEPNEPEPELKEPEPEPEPEEIVVKKIVKRPTKKVIIKDQEAKEPEEKPIKVKRTKKQPIKPTTFIGEEEDPLKTILGGSGEELLIDPKTLTGIKGLSRVMNFLETKTPAFKGDFEYKKNVPHIFEPNEIGKYSSKIKNICESIYNSTTNTVSDGIILIYSAYIDGGIIPTALALEEMGFTRYGKAKPLFKEPPTPIVDVRTMKPPTDRADFKPARYVMITGDGRLSPNNDADVKALTTTENLLGEQIKVVLISQAGSEGLDFKTIRQIHIIDPWYNLNRIEQIIGRGVRNFSHKDLPFSQRNVQIFLYGTLLSNAEEEAVDLYVYRKSEQKAIKIGQVTRLLKQTAVDCIINHDQTKLVSKNFDKIKENKNITQVLSDKTVLEHFKVGDIDNSATCDYMKCEFDCLPTTKLHDDNTDTYSEEFMLMNSDKIIQKVKTLMKIRHFYKKNNLLKLINIPKPYPTEQIYAALTQMINDNVEYITDKYDRNGHLINVGDYYLFQPIELNNPNISIYDRSVPIDYKHNYIHFDINPQGMKKTEIINNPDVPEEEIVVVSEGQKILDEIFANIDLTIHTTKAQRGNEDWFHLCGVVLKKMETINGISSDMLYTLLAEHIIESLMFQDRIHLLNYIYSNPNLEKTIENKLFKNFYIKMKTYLLTKIITTKNITGMVGFDGPSRINNILVYVLRNNVWEPAQPMDKSRLEDAITNKYTIKGNLHQYVGFIGFENNKKYMVYKVKDTDNTRSTGFRCDQSGKKEIVKLLNNIEQTDAYTTKGVKEGGKELCVKQELLLRIYSKQQKDNKIWFVDTETAIFNEFEKKEK